MCTCPPFPLKVGETLRVVLELNNPASGLAIQLQSASDYHMLGWTPRYLVDDLVHAMAEAPTDLSATVAQINSPPAPYHQRVLIDFSGKLPVGREPMSAPELQPLVA